MDALAVLCTETYPYTYMGDPSYPEFYMVGPGYKEDESTIILWVDFTDPLPCEMATFYFDGVSDSEISWFIINVFSLGIGIIKRVTIWDDVNAEMQVIEQIGRYAH